MKRQRTLLGVWAHPDDEAYLSAGLMAEARRNGERVVVLTATLGDHGTSDPKRFPPACLRRLRHHELRKSLAAVGVDELRIIGFEDGTCHEREGTATVADHIADVAPDRIVTFGPDGITGHPRPLRSEPLDDGCVVGSAATSCALVRDEDAGVPPRVRRGQRGDRPLERAAGATVHARARV